MPFTTQVPDATIDLSVATPVLTINGSQLVLNDLKDSREFAKYDVEATGATTLQAGDELTLVDSQETPVSSGTYAGTMVYSTTQAKVNLAAVSVELKVNPVKTHAYVDDANNVFLISDTPLDEDHIMVTMTVKLSVLGVSTTLLNVNVPVSQAADQILNLAGLPVNLNVLANAVQTTLDTVTVNLAYDSAGRLQLSEEQVIPCFVKGSLIQTRRGLVAVEDLVVGDMVFTQDHGFQPIRWIGSVTLDQACLASHKKLWPIRIRAGALGIDMPSEDLLVSPQHRILLRSKIAVRMFDTDEILVAAKHLIGAEGIDVVEEPEEVTYFHFLCDQHEVVYSNGAATEAMYTGAQALRAVGAAAREEILTLFPELRDPATQWQPARPFVPGTRARRLVDRHCNANKALVS